MQKGMTNQALEVKRLDDSKNKRIPINVSQKLANNKLSFVKTERNRCPQVY